MRQLPLTLRWPAQQRLETFVAGENAAARALVEQAALAGGTPWIFLSGAPGTGKSHLLLAACAAASEHGRSAQYLALQRDPDHAPAALRGVGGSDVLALDGVEAIAGRRDAEQALFDLYNRSRAEQATLIFAARAAPARLGITLPDLVSRLSACTQLPLKPLGEEDRRSALRARAHALGIALDDGVIDWLLARSQRDLGTLAAVLDRIDRESLAAKRRVTVPFLRTLFGRELQQSS
ncbi:MAG TPA: DnaA regulatory inactivator Hda [Rudaea sp.]